MAEAVKKMRTMSEEARKRKRERDSARGKRRIDLGKEFTRWRLLKEQSECKTD